MGEMACFYQRSRIAMFAPFPASNIHTRLKKDLKKQRQETCRCIRQMDHICLSLLHPRTLSITVKGYKAYNFVSLYKGKLSGEEMTAGEIVNRILKVGK